MTSQKRRRKSGPVFKWCPLFGAEMPLADWTRHLDTCPECRPRTPLRAIQGPGKSTRMGCTKCGCDFSECEC